LFINEEDSVIHAIDLLTHDKTVVIRGLKNNYGMAVDTLEMKLYFINDSSISRVNLDGTGVNVFLQNANVFKMVFDWIERRIYCTTFANERIFVIHLDGERKRALTNGRVQNNDIAVDPTVG
jgi:hypothetical protein